MTLRQAGALFLAVLVAGCGSPQRLIRANVDEGVARVHVPRLAEVQPVKVTPEEVARTLQMLALEVRLSGTPREAVWRMFQLDALNGEYLYLLREKKLVPTGAGAPLKGALTDEEETLASDYMGWCARAYGFQEDCLGGALVGGRYLDLQGRYVLALALSKSPVIPEMQAALGKMASFQAILSAALWTIPTVLFLLSLPEPVTKGLAATLAAVLILWIGAETLYNLVAGWFELMEEVKHAATFEEIRAAGEKYGRLIGRDAARAFAMLATAAIGQTAQGFMAKVPTLPGSAQVSAQAEAHAGFSLPAAAVVEEVAVTAEGFSVTLPSGVVAMAAQASRGSDECVETHHIATICNDKSTLRGGPWTPRFRRLFARAGMKLTDKANEVPLPGHKGPHPERYHELVFNRLSGVMRSCRSIEDCRRILTRELHALAKEIATPGTELNQLITQGKPR
jgi:hypothetical protein